VCRALAYRISGVTYAGLVEARLALARFAPARLISGVTYAGLVEAGYGRRARS